MTTATEILMRIAQTRGDAMLDRAMRDWRDAVVRQMGRFNLMRDHSQRVRRMNWRGRYLRRHA